MNEEQSIILDIINPVPEKELNTDLSENLGEKLGDNLDESANQKEALPSQINSVNISGQENSALQASNIANNILENQQKSEHDHVSDHDHSHDHGHEHNHTHGRTDNHEEQQQVNVAPVIIRQIKKEQASATSDETLGGILTIRAHSGLSGDIFLAGLLKITECSEAELERLLISIMPELANSVKLVRKQVNYIGGWHAEVNLPSQHEHRNLYDIKQILDKSSLTDAVKAVAFETFTLLAKAEAIVHGTEPDKIHFHEVGALDSIVDICLSCALFAKIAPKQFIVSSLPVADGSIRCSHGIIPTPAPAVLEMLRDVPVRPFPGQGETVTPTALALLHSLKAEYGLWPLMRVQRSALVYGTRVFEQAPNGAVFAWGHSC